MRIKKIHITGFGIHEDASWQLDADMRVFFGLNERGKTTIAKFIEFILYGEDALGGRKATNTYEPVGRAVHSGSLEVESCGRALTIARAFGKKNSLTVTDESGNSVPPAEFETTLKHHVSRDNFAGVFSMDVDDLAAAPDNGDALGNIFFDTLGGGAGVSAQAARDSIRDMKNKMYELNKKSQVNSRMFRLKENLKTLISEIEAGKTAAAEYERLARQRDDAQQRKARQDKENDEIAEQLREKRFLISLHQQYVEYRKALAAREAATHAKDFPANGLQQLEIMDSDISESEHNLKNNEAQANSNKIEIDQIASDPRWLQNEAQILDLYNHKSLMIKENENLVADKDNLQNKSSEIAAKIAIYFPGATREDIESMGAGITERGVISAAIEAVRRATENVRVQSDKLESLRNALRETDMEIDLLNDTLLSASSVSGEMPPDAFRAQINDWKRAYNDAERLEQERIFAASSPVNSTNASSQPPRASSMPLIIGGLLLIVFGILLILFKPAASLIPGLALAAMGAALLFLSLRAGARKPGPEPESDHDSYIREIETRLEKARGNAEAALSGLGLDSLDVNTADMLLQRLSDQQGKLQADHGELERKKQRQDRQAREISEFEFGQYARAKQELAQAERTLTDLKSQLRLPGNVATSAITEMHNAVGEIKRLFAEQDTLSNNVESRSRALRDYAQRARDSAELLGVRMDDNTGMFTLVENLYKEFVNQRDAGAQRNSLLKDAARIQKERDTLLGKLSELKEKRNELLAAGGAPGDAQAFKERAKTYTAYRKAEFDMDSKRSILITAKSADEDEEQFFSRIQNIFASGIDALQSDARALETRKQNIEAERDQTIREQATVDNDIQALLNQDELKGMEQEYDGMLVELAELSQTWNRLALAERIMSVVADEDEKNRMPDIKRDATELFAAFTGGEYDGLRIDTAQRTVHAVRGGMDVAVPRLSRSVRHELYLALRFAQVLHLARTAPTETMPVLLDDVFVDIDDNRLPRVVRAIAEAFKPLKTQIIHFTAHEHIRDVFEEVFGEECIIQL